MPLKDLGLRRLRAKQFLDMRAKGATLEECAKHFNVHVRTITRMLKFAQQQDLMREMEDQIVEDILPLAAKSIKRALENEENGMVALELFKGRGLLTKQVAQPKQMQQAVDDEDLSSYISGLIGDEDPIDGQVVAPEKQASISTGSAEELKRLPQGTPEGSPSGGQDSE